MKIMRTKSSSLGAALIRLFALPLALFLGQNLLAAVTFTNTPSAVSNTYSGPITLQVSGLTNGETVVVQKFMDLNTNGVIDASDWLVQQFQMTEGQAGMVIGGVTNFNVPGDFGSTTGAITAKLNFQNGDFLQNIVGKYLFKLSSPTGHFQPLTNSFSVTNFPYAQKVTGNVVNSGTNVPNATVLLFGTTGKGSPLAGAVANNSGSYTIPAPLGTYGLVAFKTNYLGNFSAPPVVSLGSGATITTNLTLTNATASIYGKVVDAANASIGLPGVMVSAQSTNGLLAVCCTATNGSFNLRVTAGQWSTRGADDTSLIIHGYVGLQDQTNVLAGTTNLALAVPKGTALFYGSVKDILGNPLPGIDVYASDEGDQHQTDGYTDTNGNYFVAVPAGNWNLQISSDGRPTNYVFTGSTGNSFSGGEAVEWDFTAISATNHIAGNVKVGSTNAVGVWVSANATINGTNFQVGMDTDNSGNYWLNVAGSNTWMVGVQTGGGDYSLPSGYLCGNQSVSLSNNNAVVNFTAVLATNFITGHVQDSSGNPISGLGVMASATINSAVYNVVAGTDGSGNYSLNSINGNWSVDVFCSGGPGGSMNNLDNLLGPGNYQCPGNQNVTVSNANPTVSFTVQLCNGVQILTTNLPDGQVNVSYDTWLTGSGCTGNLTWSLNFGGSFPPGLNLSSQGEIYGTPTNSGTFGFSVHLDDGNGHTADQGMSLYIAPAALPLQITTTLLPNGTNGGFYAQQLQSSGGQPPRFWSLSPGSASLPFNLTLTTNGVLSGLLVTNGTFNFSVRVTDSAAATVDQSLSLTIASVPLLITTASLPNATQNAFYSATLTGSGGQPPYTWSLAPGSANLPSGLALATNGVISGITGGTGTSQFIVVLADATAEWTYQLFSLTINASTNKPLVTITAAARLGDGRFQFTFNTASGVNYTIQYSTNLSDWNSILTLSGSGMPSTIIDPGAIGDSRCFYRVKIGP